MKTEIGFAIGILTALVLKAFHVPGATIILTIILSSLMMIYFYGGIYFFSDKKFKQQNYALSIVSGVFLSIAPVGILFKIQHWPGAQNILNISVVVIPILLGVTMFLKNKSKIKEELKGYYKNMIIRISVSMALVFIFFIIVYKKKHILNYYKNKIKLYQLITIVKS